MEKETYQISEAEQLTGEKAHVLRYWEDELGLTIGRNAMGHRFYTAEDIQIFLSIKELKKKGLHLKAIRDLLPKLRQAAGQAVPESAAEEDVEIEVLPARADLRRDRRDLSEVETVEVRQIDIPGEMLTVVQDPVSENEQRDGKEAKGQAAKSRKNGGRKQEKQEQKAEEEASGKERQEQFYQILERLLRQLMLKKRQEERYKRVDEAIRKHQQSRKEAAATAEQFSKKNKKGAGRPEKKRKNR